MFATLTASFMEKDGLGPRGWRPVRQPVAWPQAPGPKAHRRMHPPLCTRMRALGVLLIYFVFTAGTLQAEPALRWAADPDSNAPYAFYDSGNQLAGFEYDVIVAIARHLGRKAEFVQNDWAGLIP